MHTAKRKIAIERFMTYPSQIVSLVNRRGMEVVVYDEKGPIARLTPYKKSPVVAITNLRNDVAVMDRDRAAVEMMDISEISADQLSQGGVWKMSSSFKKEIDKPAWLRKLSGFSISGLLKKIREVETLPSSIRA
jgi:hypothetical protein